MKTEADASPEALQVFDGGGRMGERMRAFDWRSHPLGTPDAWPRSLRIVVRLMLTSRYAMWIGWGPEFYFFYNDAYQPTLGIKDDWALGAPARRVWAEIWNDIGPRAASVVREGRATWDEALRLFLERSGAPEETYHTFSYSPVPADDGGTGGMLCVVTEDTERVIGERRLAFLRELASELSRCHQEAQVLQAIAAEFGAHPQDVPFALLYLVEEDGVTATLGCRAGIPAGHPAGPPRLRLDDPEAFWPLAEVARSGQALHLRDVNRRAAEPLPSGPWERPARDAKVVPTTVQGQERPAGFLIAGLNPYRPVDDAYRGFVRLLAGQISAGLSNARAHEAERRRAQALADLDRAKTEFFSNVSHEFRTPLTLMLAPLEDEMRERPEGSERIRTAHRNSLRLLKLVNSLLDFSRIEAGRSKGAYVRTNLGQFTAELASAFEPVIEKAGLRLIVATSSAGTDAHVDRAMWEKIVFNLLSNAFKFTFKGEIEVTVGGRGDRVELAVRDTGTGIPAAELPRIFERFHRVRGARSRSHEGTGIGLALVHQLVRLHGGEVTVESEERIGTTFRVWVPTGTIHLPADRAIVPVDPEAGGSAGGSDDRLGAAAYVEEAGRWLPDDLTDEEGPEEGPGEREGRIVLADDNPDMRAYLARLLSARHYVVATGDGEAALAAVEADPPDLVLADVMMPKLDGFGLLRRLRSSPRTAAVPVILLSARAGEDARVEGLQRGADDYLVKPFSARELLARVRTHLELARVRREAAERVRESEERFRHVADHSPAMFWMSETDGSFSYFNDRWYEFTGLAREESLGDGWKAAVHPEDLPRLAAALTLARADQKAFRTEYRLRRHEGEYRWVLDEGAPRRLQGAFAGFVGSLVDITEQREELEAAERSRSQMQMALQAARSGAFSWDLEAGTVSWSAELEALYGMPTGGFRRSYADWSVRIEPQDLAKFEQHLRQVFGERRQEADFEFRARMPDGTQRWMMAKARITYGPGGRPRQMLGINFDIDERKRAQMNMELIGRLGQEIAQMSDPDAIERAAVDAVGRMLAVQRCYFLSVSEDRSGGYVKYDYRRDEAVTSLVGSYLLADFGAPAVWAEMSTRGIAIDDVAAHPLTRAHAEAYARLPLLAWMAAPFVSEGQWRAVLVVNSERPRRWTAVERELLDLVVNRVWPNVERARTGQAMAEAQLAIRLSEERLRATIAAARLGTWDYNPRNRSLIWDARCKELFGLPADAADDIDLALRGVHSGDRERMRDQARQALGLGGNGAFDVELRTVGIGDRVERWVRMTGQASFEHGTAVRIIGTLLDITEIVKARETLAERRAELERQVAERTARLQETVAELEGFSYSISHDLRAPLRAMQSFAQLLADECGGQLSADGRDYVRRIVAGSARMDRLIHDVLVYSRVARTELPLGPVDLQPLVEGIVESYPQFSARTADVVVAPNLPRVIGNEAALTQCISNLIGNAVKVVAPGVRPRVEVTGAVKGTRAQLSIRDNGIGIDPSQHDKIFGIFERLSRDYEGTGIGLAVVRKAAERMGGSIAVESAPGQGSAFTLELPGAPPP